MLNLSKIQYSFSLFMTAIFLTFFPILLQADWSPPVNVSTTGFNTTGAQIIVDKNGQTTAIWSGFDGHHFVIQTSTKSETGTWSTPIAISEAGRDAFYPQITADPKGNLYAVWSRKSGKSYVIQSSIKYTKRDWSTPLDVSAQGLKKQNALFPQVLFGNDGETYAIWQKNNGTTKIIQFAMKEKANDFWSETITLSNNQNSGSGCITPQFAINQYGDLFAVWINNEKKSVEFSLKHFGQDWTPAKNISASGKRIQDAQIVIDGTGNAIASWTRKNGRDLIVQATYRPKGGPWGVAVNLSTPGENALFPSLSISKNGNAVIAWQRSDGVYSIIQATTKLQDGNWSQTVDLTATGQDASNPRTATDNSNRAVITWKRSNGANFVIQESITTFGSNWSSPITLSEEGEDAINPSISINETGSAGIIWQRSNGVDTIVQNSSNQL